MLLIPLLSRPKISLSLKGSFIILSLQPSFLSLLHPLKKAHFHPPFFSRNPIYVRRGRGYQRIYSFSWSNFPRFLTKMLFATTTSMINLLLVATLGIFTVVVAYDLPEQMCNSFLNSSSSSNAIDMPIVLKMHELLRTIDEASVFSRNSCGAGCDELAPSFNATELAARDAVRALSAYTGRLNISIKMYVIFGFHDHER